jgi:hypothetical protein
VILKGIAGISNTDKLIVSVILDKGKVKVWVGLWGVIDMGKVYFG